MKPDDRIRVLAPVSGQVAAFAAVLVLGLVFGHRASSPHPRISPAPTRSHSASSTPIPTVPGPAGKLRVIASKPAAGDPVAVLNALTPSHRELGKIGADGQYNVQVPLGSYLVCLAVPKGYAIGSSKTQITGGQSTGSATLRPLPADLHLSGGPWQCVRTQVGSAPVGMTFELTKSPGSSR
jgi:hypothetical protein